MRVVFFGFGELGAVVLSALAEHHDVRLVVTHQPEFTGLGEPDVLRLAERLGLAVCISSHAAELEVAAALRAAAPEVLVSTNWRTKLPAELLPIAPLGALNVHDALLPRYSGFGAVNWAIRNGEKETGVTVHIMEPELDSGPIIAQTVVEIGTADTATDVYEAVTAQYVPTTLLALERRAAGDAGVPQDRGQRTFYHRIRTPDVRIDWSMSTTALYDLIRAQSDPYVNAWTMYDGRVVHVKTASIPADAVCGTPGRSVRVAEQGVAVACGQLGRPDSRGIVLRTVAPDGGEPIPATTFFGRMGGYLN